MRLVVEDEKAETVNEEEFGQHLEAPNSVETLTYLVGAPARIEAVAAA
jgi:hypothetical protein